MTERFPPDLEDALDAARSVRAPANLFDRIAADDAARRSAQQLSPLRAAAAFLVGATLFATAALVARGSGRVEIEAHNLLTQIGAAVRVVASDSSLLDSSPEGRLLEALQHKPK